MTKRHSNELFFTLKDFQLLYKKNRSSYLKIGAFCFCGFLAWSVVKTPTFKAEAKFKKSAQSQEVPSPLKVLLSNMPFINAHTNIASTMKSRFFLQEVVTEMGLQMSVKERGMLSNAISHMKYNILGEMHQKVSTPKGFSFVNVRYDEADPFQCYLKFYEGGDLEVLDNEGATLARSRVGSLVAIEKASFIVAEVPDHLHFQKPYLATIVPWDEVVKKIQRQFYVKEESGDQEVLQLSYLSENQKQSADFLNTVMRRYVEYVKKEKEDLTQVHLTFLQDRKKELEETYGRFLDEHVRYLEKSLENEGFMGLRQELEILEKPNEDYHTKLYEVELELNRLRPLSATNKIEQNEKKEEKELIKLEKNTVGRSKSSLLNKNVSLEESSSLYLQEKLGGFLRQKSDDREYSKTEIMAFANSFLQEDLQLLAQYKSEALNILQLLDKKNAPTESPSLQFPPNSILANWIGQLNADEKKLQAIGPDGKEILTKKFEDKKTRLKDLLGTFLLAIEKKQNSLLDKEIEDSFTSVELQGLNPETAQKLYLEYNHELDAVKLNIKQLIYIKEQIYDPNVELSSLCNLLTDPISQQMIQKAGQMSLDLRDDFNRSSKEHERLKDSLSTQKSFLMHHIAQMIEIQRMRAKLVEEKILSLQQSSVNLLSTEKHLIEDRLLELRKKMSSSLPKKWKLENQLQLQKELYKSMIEGISQLEESKRIDQNILPSACKVVDSALVPKKVLPPGLFFYSLLIAVVAMIFKYVVDFSRRISRGSPISSDLLKHYDFHNCGSVSCYADAPIAELKNDDLETLRKISHFAYQQKFSSEGLSLALLGNSNANYSGNLAGILSHRGAKVLLIDSCFHGLSSGQSAKGLLAFLRGETEQPLIHNRGSYDFIYAGGYSRSFVDLLAHKKFADFILDRKKEYDFVVIHSQASGSSLEAMVYQSISDICVIAAGFEESLEDLENFIQWKESKKRDCLTFVLREA